MTDTETYIVQFTQLIELAVARGGSTCMVCGVDFIMEASPLPPSLPVSDIGEGGGGRRTSFNTFQIPRKGKALNIISLVIYTCIYFSLYGMLFLFPKSLRVFPACVLCD